MENSYQDYNKVSGRRSGSDRRMYPDSKHRGVERRVAEDRRKKTRKRTHIRFQAKDLTFVKLCSKSDVDIGQMLDISKGGLSLRYFIDSEKSQDYSELGIFLSGGDFIIDQIPFRTVSDTLLNSSPPFSVITLRRFSVQFDKMPPDKIAKLDDFLLNHTLGEA